MGSSSLTLAVGLLFVSMAGIHGCSAASEDPNFPSLAGTAMTSSSEPFTRLLASTTSGFSEPVELTVRDQTAYNAAWRTIHNGVSGNDPPAVNFAQKMVIVLALGQRSTGGYAIRFDSMTVEATGPIVRYTVTSPGTGCITTQALTSPVDAVVVRRLDGQVRFEAKAVVQGC